MATLQSLQKNFSSSFSCCFFWQNSGLFNTASMSWSCKSFSPSVLCSVLVRIMVCAKTHSSHQKEQHWKQYKVWALRLSQFPHFTLAVLHSFIAKISSKLLIRKLVGSSTSRDLKLSPTLGAGNFTADAARSLNSVQAMETETVQARQLLWISECTHTHRTGYFIIKIVEQGLYIHGKLKEVTK